GKASNLFLGATISGNGAGLTNVSGANIQRASITSDQIDPLTWQSATAPGSNALAAFAVTSSGRNDLNRWCWINTLKKIARSEPIQLMIMGDSVASGSFVPIYSALKKIYGFAGAVGPGGDDVLNMTVTPPASWINPPDVWFENY